MNKRKICLVTNWYPTKENPVAGSFFKEQAFALDAYFDFLVIHYTEKNNVLDPVYWFYRLRNRHVRVQQVNAERNTTEYNVEAMVPLSVSLIRKIRALISRYLKCFESAGSEPKCYLRHRQKRFRQMLRTGVPADFDVLYCVSAQTESWTVQQLAEITGKPYVVAEHAPFPWPGTVIKPREKTAIMQADAFLAISCDKIRQVLLQDVRPKQFFYVGNMVDEQQFPLSAGSGGDKTFVIVAAYSFYKNYPLFIEVFDRLTQITHVPFRVMIVGYNANKGYSQNAEELEQKIRESLFADKAELIPAVSRDQMHTVYARADAFVMTSIQEGMPVSAMEAGCCGLPIFSTMCGGVEDYVDDTMGRIFKIIDSETFAQGLKAYLEGEITFDKTHIRQQVIDRFGRRAFTENMAEIFNQVIDLHK